MIDNLNITQQDMDVVRSVRGLLLAIMAVPLGPLEHLVQVAHESDCRDMDEPPELFQDEGLTRQALRMFWQLRHNLAAVMPGEAHQ